MRPPRSSTTTPTPTTTGACSTDSAALHGDAVAWLTPLEHGLPRLGGYRARLDRALERAAGRRPASTSPHRAWTATTAIWFELHEDLIRLAGRTREDEVAAGRA